MNLMYIVSILILYYSALAQLSKAALVQQLPMMMMMLLMAGVMEVKGVHVYTKLNICRLCTNISSFFCKIILQDIVSLNYNLILFNEFII